MVSRQCACCKRYYYSDTVQGMTEFFNWRNKNRELLASYCKSCRKEINKQRYEDNKDNILEKNKDYYENNKDKFKEYYLNSKNKRKVSSHLWNIENKDKRVAYNKKYYDKKLKIITTGGSENA